MARLNEMKRFTTIGERPVYINSVLVQAILPYGESSSLLIIDGESERQIIVNGEPDETYDKFKGTNGGALDVVRPIVRNENESGVFDDPNM